jgi:CheY-like chemotaxis protein
MACAHSVTPATILRGRRILVAEDHPINQVLVRRLLERVGLRVSLAADGEAALSMWREAPNEVDLILMDIQMPIMDGLETTRRIRQDESAGNGYTPIVALTAHAMVGDEGRCLEAGMDAYLSKPIDTALLFSTLQRFLMPESCAT